MKDARTAILHRVRRAQQTGRVPGDPSRRALEVPRRRPLEHAALDRFLLELEGVGVTARVAASADDVRLRVSEILENRTVFSWDSDQLPYEIGQVLDSAAIFGTAPRERQATADIGLTGCHGAIVETGSIVVLSGRGTPRAASLLPATHLCVVRRADLYLSTGEFFRDRADDIAAAACCTFITGPSRTADIELTLTLGVHGPRSVIVIVGP